MDDGLRLCPITPPTGPGGTLVVALYRGFRQVDGR